MKLIVFYVFFYTSFLSGQRSKGNYSEIVNNAYWAKDSTFETGYRQIAFALILESKYDYSEYLYEDIIYVFGNPILKKEEKILVLEYPISASFEECEKLYKAIDTNDRAQLAKMYFKNCQARRYFLVFRIDAETQKVLETFSRFEEW